MIKKLEVLQGVLLTLLGAALVLLGIAVYTILREDGTAHYNNARFVSAPAFREVRAL